jgi:hypothetical protein
MIRRQLLLPVAAWAAALVVAACQNDAGPGQCFESGATSYPFVMPGDPTAWFHWLPPDYPVRVYAEPVGDNVANTDTAIVLWLSAFRCGELNLVRWSDSNTADIVVRNPPVQPPFTPTTFATAADSTSACRGRTDIPAWDSSLVFPRPIRSYVWPMGVDPAATASCYRFVTLHELGHALGLFAHSPDTLDIMHFRPRRRAISINDRYTVQVLHSYQPSLRAAPR